VAAAVFEKKALPDVGCAWRKLRDHEDDSGTWEAKRGFLRENTKVPIDQVALPRAAQLAKTANSQQRTSTGCAICKVAKSSSDHQ
jgi:hypothetical protein